MFGLSVMGIKSATTMSKNIEHKIHSSTYLNATEMLIVNSASNM